MASTRYKFQGTSVQLDNGDVLVATGARVAEILDHRSFTFRSVPGVFPTALYFATATLLSGSLLPLAFYPWGIGDVFGWLPFAAMAWTARLSSGEFP